MQHDLWQQAHLQTAEVIAGLASDTIVRLELLTVVLTGATIDQYPGCQQAELNFMLAAEAIHQTEQELL
ncbi:MAG: hypothetical protein U1F76_30285 [Candidatus Competibacteraceae bacterium]